MTESLFSMEIVLLSLLLVRLLVMIFMRVFSELIFAMIAKSVTTVIGNAPTVIHLVSLFKKSPSWSYLEIR